MNTRKSIFFTSDWHIGHANCINFDNRPFKDVDDMHKSLIRNFNKQVPTYGVTYFLGDIGVTDIEATKNVLSKLNGLKVMIRGNHDRNVQSCYNQGFDLVLESATILIHNELVTLSHYPLKGLPREDMSEYPHKGTNWHGENRHRGVVENYGQFHIHGHIHCLSEDTELYTNNGWKLYNQINNNDLVISRNIETGIDEWTNIDKLITSEYSGKMLNLKSQHFDQMITPNHRLISKNHNNDKYTLSTYDELKYTISKFPVVTNINQNSEGLTYSDDVIRLIIWIIADGHIEPDSTGIRFRLKKERKIKRLSELLDRLGYNFTHKIHKSGVNVIRIRYDIINSDIMMSINPFNKSLPNMLKNANKRQALIIMEEYANTDGCYCKGNPDVIQISTAKREEVDIIQEIGILNDIWVKVQKKKNSNSWIIYVNKKRKLASVHVKNNYNEIDYNGIVWCLQVKNENFLIRRNGCVSFTGNSPNSGKSQKILDRQFDVGVVANNYRPVHISEIESWIMRTKNDESNSSS